MDIKYYDVNGIGRIFRDISHFHQLAFCASVCERIIPNYNIFARESNLETAPILRESLDTIWSFLSGSNIDREQIRELSLNCEDIIPDDEDNNYSGFNYEAQKAAACLSHTLDLCLEPSEAIVKMVIYCVHSSLDIYLQYIIYASLDDDSEGKEPRNPEVIDTTHILQFRKLYNQYSDPDDYDREHSKKISAIIKNHCLVLREIEKENEDLLRLKESPVLTPEILKLLRTSSENDGKSFLNIC
ncbi:DUF416 family protein [Chamaesiphon sp.]|uniref:DUF416 family protein n=1 Tax=Chamaesiphon sp. TaxID=2814140 RepID=UPI0035931036